MILDNGLYKNYENKIFWVKYKSLKNYAHFNTYNMVKFSLLVFQLQLIIFEPSCDISSSCASTSLSGLSFNYLRAVIASTPADASLRHYLKHTPKWGFQCWLIWFFHGWLSTLRGTLTSPVTKPHEVFQPYHSTWY